MLIPFYVKETPPTSGGSGLVGWVFSCTASVRTGLAFWTSDFISGFFIRLFRDVLYPCRFSRLTLPRRPPLLHSFRVFTTVMPLNKQRIELKSTLSTVFASSLLQNFWNSENFLFIFFFPFFLFPLCFLLLFLFLFFFLFFSPACA